jgi:hypothetical protein
VRGAGATDGRRLLHCNQGPRHGLIVFGGTRASGQGQGDIARTLKLSPSWLNGSSVACSGAAVQQLKENRTTQWTVVMNKEQSSK